MEHRGGLRVERWSYVSEEHLRGAAAQREMVQALLDHARSVPWPDAIAAAIGDATGRAVAVIEPGGRILASAGDAPDPSATVERPRRSEAREWHDGWWACEAPGPFDRTPVVWLHDPAHDAPPVELLLLEAAARVAMIEARQADAVAAAELRMWGGFASELLAGTDPDRLRAHADALGYDLDRPHRVVVVDTDAAPLDEARVRLVLRTVERDAQLVRVGARLAVVLPGEPHRWEPLIGAVDAVAGPGAARIGVSGPHPDARCLQEALGEADLAVNLGRALGDPRLVRYDDLGVVRLLAGGSDMAHLERFVLDAVGPLATYDADHGTELLQTLDAWLERNGSLDQLADSLSIHRSTLAYRLRRIEELLGRALDDPGSRLELTIAARAAFVFRAVSGNPRWPAASVDAGRAGLRGA